MLKIEYLATLPANFPEIVDEIATAFATLYGPLTEIWYRDIAARAMQENIRQPHVNVLGVWDRTTLAAFLVSVQRRGIEQISFMHVLERYTGHGLEQRLIQRFVNLSRKQESLKGILSEFVAVSPLELDEIYHKLGFEHIQRAIMQAQTAHLIQDQKETIQSYPAPEDEFPDVATIIVDAYRNHPGQRLHLEVQNTENALEYIKQVASGDFGTVRNGFLRLIRRDGIPMATILGCEALPDYGFIMQVAVRQAWQGQKLGTQLIQALATEFHKAGIKKTALGVTLSNPAFNLYQQLGFTIQREVDAYVWWRSYPAG